VHLLFLGVQNLILKGANARQEGAFTILGEKPPFFITFACSRGILIFQKN